MRVERSPAGTIVARTAFTCSMEGNHTRLVDSCIFCRLRTLASNLSTIEGGCRLWQNNKGQRWAGVEKPAHLTNIWQGFFCGAFETYIEPEYRVDLMADSVCLA